MISRASVDAALDRVVDPCSNALGEPMGLGEMGLVQRVEIDDVAGSVLVTMRLTSPCCAYGPTMAEAARQELQRVPDVRRVGVEIDHAAMWTPADISRVGWELLDERRRRTIEVTGIRPFDWSSV